MQAMMDDEDASVCGSVAGSLVLSVLVPLTIVGAFADGARIERRRDA
jgi:hypothetical protein